MIRHKDSGTFWQNSFDNYKLQIELFGWAHGLIKTKNSQKHFGSSNLSKDQLNKSLYQLALGIENPNAMAQSLRLFIGQNLFGSERKKFQRLMLREEKKNAKDSLFCLI